MVKKRHHFLSKFYLKGFSNPRTRLLSVYEKGKHEYFSTNPINVAVKKDYYSFLNDKGEKDSESIEGIFEIIEKPTAKIIKKIISEESLDEENRLIFSYFLSICLTRVPNFRENFENVYNHLIQKTTSIIAGNRESFDESIKNFEEKTGQKMTVPNEELRQFVLGNEYEIKVNPQVSVETFKLAKELAPVFFDMKWLFLRATDEYDFLTSDNPIFYFDPMHQADSFYGVGLANKNIEVSFPVSKEIAFLGTWTGQSGIMSGTNKIVKAINKRTILAARRFVFASKEDTVLKNFVNKFMDSHPEITFN